MPLWLEHLLRTLQLPQDLPDANIALFDLFDFILRHDACTQARPPLALAHKREENKTCRWLGKMKTKEANSEGELSRGAVQKKEKKTKEKKRGGGAGGRTRVMGGGSASVGCMVVKFSLAQLFLFLMFHPLQVIVICTRRVDAWLNAGVQMVGFVLFFA